MPPVYLIQTNSMFKGFSIEHRHVLREDAYSEPNLPPPRAVFFFFFSPQPLSTVVLMEGDEYSHRAVYVLLHLGPTDSHTSLQSSPHDKRTKYPSGVSRLVTERCLRMRINTLFIRCLSTEPVFECFTQSMNGAA